MKNHLSATIITLLALLTLTACHKEGEFMVF